MIQLGTKSLILSSILLFCACSNGPKNSEEAFKYVKDVFVGDVLFSVHGISIDSLKLLLKNNLALVGNIKEASPAADRTNAILMVNISPLFIEEHLRTNSLNQIVELHFSLIAPANLSIKKDITLKGLIWEKRLFLDAKLENFEQKLTESIHQCVEELKDNFDKEKTSPTFYI